jgi:hypothetical protein
MVKDQHFKILNDLPEQYKELLPHAMATKETHEQ